MKDKVSITITLNTNTLTDAISILVGICQELEQTTDFGTKKIGIKDKHTNQIKGVLEYNISEKAVNDFLSYQTKL